MEKYAAVVKKLNELNHDSNTEAVEQASYTQLWLPSRKESEDFREANVGHESDASNPEPQEAEFLGAKAIGNLQQRSHRESHHGPAGKPPFVTEPSTYEDDLIAQEIHRLELKAIEINNRSKQQAADILDLKRAAQQATIAFGRQGIHDHPQLAVISHFFDRYAASHVPLIERDERGHFTLSDYTINLRRAEEEAIENAAILRGNRSFEAVPPVRPFSQPLEDFSAPPSDNSATVRAGRQRVRTNRSALQEKVSSAIRDIGAFWHQRLHAVKRRKSKVNDASAPFATERYVEAYPRQEAFSLVDGAIWFSAAAIARITLESVVAFVPLLQPALWLLPLGVFGLALYLFFVTKSNNTSLMYRLVIAALGLFLGNPF